MATTTSLSPEAIEALTTFSEASTSPEDRREALSTLSATKVLPKQADDPAITAGRNLLLQQAMTAENPGHRMLAIAECIRLTQIVKRLNLTAA